jgi:hypothetical protein
MTLSEVKEIICIQLKERKQRQKRKNHFAAVLYSIAL